VGLGGRELGQRKAFRLCIIMVLIAKDADGLLKLEVVRKVQKLQH
jgi:hypothetical protein